MSVSDIAEIVKNKFIFVSYCHEDKQVFDACTHYLIGEGVRLATDKSFLVGDKWEELAELVLEHHNCNAVIWLCSENSIKSKSVCREITIALKIQEIRSRDEYPIFVVSVCSDGNSNSYIKLLKKSFDLLSLDVVDDKFDVDMLKNLLRVIDGGSICVMSCNSGYPEELIKSIRQKIPGTIDKSNVILKEIEDACGKNDTVCLNMGTYSNNSKKEPIKWRFLRYEGNHALLLSESIIDVSFGGEQLEQWLNGEFRNSAFTADERQVIKGSLRLISKTEAEELSAEVRSRSSEWWLSDLRGSLQSIVRDDGSIYSNGYNNKRFKKGIRPVITLAMDYFKELVLNQKASSE